MPKIRVTGIAGLIDVSEDDIKKIQEAESAEQKKVRLGNGSVYTVSEIKTIQAGPRDDDRKHPMQMSDAELDLELGNWPKVRQEAIDKNPEIVRNPVLGHIAQGLVDLAVERGAIVYRGNSYGYEAWSVQVPEIDQWMLREEALSEKKHREERNQKDAQKTADFADRINKMPT